MWEQNRNGTLYLCERAYEPLTGRAHTVSVKIAKDTVITVAKGAVFQNMSNIPAQR